MAVTGQVRDLMMLQDEDIHNISKRDWRRVIGSCMAHCLSYGIWIFLQRPHSNQAEPMTSEICVKLVSQLSRNKYCLHQMKGKHVPGIEMYSLQVKYV